MKAPVQDPRWTEEIWRLWEHDTCEMWDPAKAPQVWCQYHNQLRLYRSFAPADRRLRVADVGCAQATLALLLAEDGHEVTAVDLRQHFLDYAATRYEKGEIRFLCGNVLEIEPPGRFDVVFCNQLVEHLVYPEELVERLATWLVPGGRLVMTTPNGSYFRCGLPSFASLGEPSRHEHRQFTADADGHFFAYRPKEFAALYSSSLFSAVELRFFETPWVSGHAKVRHIQPLLGERLSRILDRATLGVPWLGRVLAHQMMIVARKNP